MQDRCSWVNLKNELYLNYHDQEWGVPVYEDRKLFEFLILEGAQAGLNWETILKKRTAYKEVFFNFDINKNAKLTDEYLERLLENKLIIRNRLKIFSVRKNAIIAQAIIKEFGALKNYFWNYVNYKPIINRWDNIKNVPTKTEISDKIAKDLKDRGMSFVGSTIIYSYMQAIGMVNDHYKDCFKYKN